MYQTVPKVELHCHIEGAADPALVRVKAKKHGVDLSRLFAADGSYDWSDFTTFIAAYDGAAAVFRDFEDYADLTETYLTASAAEGVIYTEVFISADHARRLGIPYVDYMGGIIEGMKRAEAKCGIVGRIIPLIERHFGPEQAPAAVRTSIAHLNDHIVGFGMAGDERMFTPKDFAPAFAMAAEAGLPLTCHAGELCGWEMVRDTLDAIPVKRIGHGVRSIENMDLVRRLVAEDIVLECCPGSNIALSVFPSYPAHPFVKLRDAGVKVTLNSDDPPFFHTTPGNEYRIGQEEMGLSDEELLAISRTAVEAAFCDEPTKERLRARLV